MIPPHADKNEWHCHVSGQKDACEDMQRMSVLFGQEWQCLGEGSCPSNLVPTLKAFGTKSSVSGSGKQVTAGSKMCKAMMLVHFDKALGMPGGLKASHAPLPLPCRLM
jgi:hypothetical protein